MAHGLLICDKSLISDIYCFNLKTYTDISLVNQETLEDAKKVIELKAHGDVIIALSHIGLNDIVSDVVAELRKLKNKTPIVIIGKTSFVPNEDEEGQFCFLPGNFDVPLLIKTVARIFDITAKEMAEKEVGEYYATPFNILSVFAEAPCPIFTNLSRRVDEKELVQVFKKGDPLKQDFNKYKESGVSCFYVKAEDRLHIANEASSAVLNKLENSPGNEIKEELETIEKGYDIVSTFLSDPNSVSPEVLEEVNKISIACIKNTKRVIKQIPKMRTLLLPMLKNKTGYIFSHGVLGTYVSRHIINNISWGAQEHADKLAFVFFFHDMFLSPIFQEKSDLKREEDLPFKEDLSEKQKEVVLNHAKMASEMVKNFPRCPMGADDLIRQHHGTTNGLGFALDFKDDISPLAKVLIISEAFIEEAFAMKDAGKEMKVEEILPILNGRFKNHTYKRIIETLETFKM